MHLNIGSIETQIIKESLEAEKQNTIRAIQEMTNSKFYTVNTYFGVCCFLLSRVFKIEKIIKKL
jgi:hypothetical protein